MKKAITVGVFDLFHLGHLRVLQQAKTHGDYLIVAVHDDKLQTKGVEFLYSLEERMEFVRNLRFVDEVIPYERVDTLIQSTDFDVFVCGEDQNHQYFQKAIQWCNNNHKEVAITTRTPGISSTILREILKNKNI